MQANCYKLTHDEGPEFLGDSFCPIHVQLVDYPLRRNKSHGSACDPGAPMLLSGHKSTLLSGQLDWLGSQ